MPPLPFAFYIFMCKFLLCNQPFEEIILQLYLVSNWPFYSISFFHPIFDASFKSDFHLMQRIILHSAGGDWK